MQGPCPDGGRWGSKATCTSAHRGMTVRCAHRGMTVRSVTSRADSQADSASRRCWALVRISRVRPLSLRRRRTSVEALVEAVACCTSSRVSWA